MKKNIVTAWRRIICFSVFQEFLQKVQTQVWNRGRVEKEASLWCCMFVPYKGLYEKFQVDMVVCLHVISTRSSLRLKRKRKDERKHKKRSVFFYCGSSLLHNLSSAAESSCPPVSGLMGEGSTATAAAAFTLKAKQSRAEQSEERRWKERLKKERGSESSR